MADYPGDFDDNTGRRLLRESRLPAPAGADAEVSGPANVDLGQLTPDERIDAAVQELRSAVATALLEQIRKMPPAFFEELVLDLLHALGYGTREEDLQRVGAAGDGGIDGIISLDRLGFEKVYVQAKRWQGSVGRRFKPSSELLRRAAQRRGCSSRHPVLLGTRATSKAISPKRWSSLMVHG